MNLFKLVIGPDHEGTVCVWDAADRSRPRPLGERELVDLVTRLAETSGDIPVFGSAEDLDTWLNQEDQP